VLYEDMLADSVASDTVGDDRRQRRWALSARGLALLRKLKPRWEAVQEAFEKRLLIARALLSCRSVPSYSAFSRHSTFHVASSR
jgi:hypothetical protein